MLDPGPAARRDIHLHPASYFASQGSPGLANEARRATRTTDRSRATSRHADSPKSHARRISTGTLGAASQERCCGCKADASGSGCARPFVARAEAHAGCSTATIARGSPTGTPATDPMALVFATALLLKMAPLPGCADRVTKPRATRSVACHTQSHASRRANWVERRAGRCLAAGGALTGVLSASVASTCVALVRGSGLRASASSESVVVVRDTALVRCRRRCVQRIGVRA